MILNIFEITIDTDLEEIILKSFFFKIYTKRDSFHQKCVPTFEVPSILVYSHKILITMLWLSVKLHHKWFILMISKKLFSAYIIFLNSTVKTHLSPAGTSWAAQPGLHGSISLFTNHLELKCGRNERSWVRQVNDRPFKIII